MSVLICVVISGCWVFITIIHVVTSFCILEIKFSTFNDWKSYKDSEGEQLIYFEFKIPIKSSKNSHNSEQYPDVFVPDRHPISLQLHLFLYNQDPTLRVHYDPSHDHILLDSGINLFPN